MSTPRPHEKWCKSMPREFDAMMGRGPYECDCGAEGVAAPLEPTPQIDDAFVEQIEDALGMGHGAWDMVDPVEICKAVAAAVSKNLQEELAETKATLRRWENAWMQDETIGRTKGKPDGTLRPSLAKTIERAERAEARVLELEKKIAPRETR